MQDEKRRNKFNMLQRWENRLERFSETIIEKADKSINKHMMSIISNFHTKTNKKKKKILKLSLKFPKENIFFKFALTRVKEFRPPNSIKHKFDLFIKHLKK